MVAQRLARKRRVNQEREKANRFFSKPSGLKLSPVIRLTRLKSYHSEMNFGYPNSGQVLGMYLPSAFPNSVPQQYGLASATSSVPLSVPFGMFQNNMGLPPLPEQSDKVQQKAAHKKQCEHERWKTSHAYLKAGGRKLGRIGIKRRRPNTEEKPIIAQGFNSPLYGGVPAAPVLTNVRPLHLTFSPYIPKPYPYPYP
jgi:hypothetical protein